MKVVLFCGGLGLRMRGSGHDLPKPLVPLGSRPLLWHLMKYYAHWGHTDFILCLGHKAEAIKEYFVHYREWLSNDFVMGQGGRELTLLRRDIDDWNITFVDTGRNANIGERLQAVRSFVEDEEMFLANYSDGLTDCPLPAIVERLQATNAVGACMTAPPNLSLHFVRHGPNGLVSSVEHGDGWVNAGFFAFRPAIFDYMRPGEELVGEPFRRLIEERRLVALPYSGFWRCCDTLKDLEILEDMQAGGSAPWQVWRGQPDPARAPAWRPAEAIALRAGSRS